MWSIKTFACMWFSSLVLVSSGLLKVPRFHGFALIATTVATRGSAALSLSHQYDSSSSDHSLLTYYSDSTYGDAPTTTTARRPLQSPSGKCAGIILYSACNHHEHNTQAKTK